MKTVLQQGGVRAQGSSQPPETLLLSSAQKARTCCGAGSHCRLKVGDWPQGNHTGGLVSSSPHIPALGGRRPARVDSEHGRVRALQVSQLNTAHILVHLLISASSSRGRCCNSHSPGD